MPTPVKGEATAICVCGHPEAAHLPPTGWCTTVVKHRRVGTAQRPAKPMPVFCACECFRDAQLQKDTKDKEAESA